MFHITLDCNGRPLELDRARIAHLALSPLSRLRERARVRAVLRLRLDF